jgi:hypothetical protein
MTWTLRAWIEHTHARGLPYAGGGPPPEPTADGRWLRDPDAPCMYVYVPTGVEIEEERATVRGFKRVFRKGRTYIYALAVEPAGASLWILLGSFSST